MFVSMRRCVDIFAGWFPEQKFLIDAMCLSSKLNFPYTILASEFLYELGVSLSCSIIAAKCCMSFI